MIKKKDLLKRIQSLEEHLGVVYTVEEYPDHINRPWGKMKGLSDLLDKQEQAKSQGKPLSEI